MKTILVLITTMVSPFLVTFLLWGKYENGHIIIRYPQSTEVVSNNPDCQHYTVIVGKNDCLPAYKLTSVPFGKFGAYSKSKPTAEDEREWYRALK